MNSTAPDKIKVQCSQCGKETKERAQKIRGGHKMTCPFCKKIMSFESTSTDANVRKALGAARQIRRLATNA